MYYLGIDVAKAKLDCSLLDETGLKRKAKKVTNNQSGYVELLAWLIKQNINLTGLHVTMEATGIYHEQVAQALHDAGVAISIVNPAQIKALGKTLAVRTKTDGVDSLLIARFGLLCKPNAWVPPAPEAIALKALLARQEAISEDLQRERNRQEKSSVSTTPERVQKSLDDSITFLQAQLKQLQQEIDDHIDRHPTLKEDLGLLKSIRAIGPQVGKAMLLVMQTHSFKTAEQLAAYLGLVPVQRQSGSSVLGRTKLSKAGPPEIRAKLYMAAVVAIRYNAHAKHYTNVCVSVANPLCLLLVLACVNSFIFALVCLKHVCLTMKIMEISLDFKDGITSSIQHCARGSRLYAFVTH